LSTWNQGNRKEKAFGMVADTLENCLWAAELGIKEGTYAVSEMK